MPARLFCNIKKISSFSAKALFLPLVFLVLFFIQTTSVSADAASDAANATYAHYLNLFDGSQTGLSLPTTSGFLTQDTATNAVTGIKLNLGLQFTATDNSALSDLWSHVQNDSGYGTNGNGSFVVRLCDTSNASNCWINTIPYSATDVQNMTLGTTITQLAERNLIGSNVYRNPILISNFSLFNKADSNSPSGTDGYRYKYNRTVNGTKDEGTTSGFTPVPFTLGASYEATFWYCADNPSGEPEGSAAYGAVGNILNDKIATFGSLCGGDAYFRIGNPITVTIPATAAQVAAQNNTQQASIGGGTNRGNLPECGLIPGGAGTINGCIAQVAYYIYYVIAAIARLFGQLFDFFIGYSLSDASYRYSFAVTGWKLVRDISNVFFIIIMVWTGFSAVFNTTKTSMKAVVPNLIINALLINFSLFATRIIIDISNVTARIFYSEMLVCKQVDLDQSGNCPPAKAEHGVGGYWPLSEKIVSSFDPQDIFKSSILQPPSYSTSTSTSNTTVTNYSAQTAGSTTATSERDYANYFGIVCLVASFIMVAVAIMFFRVTFLFVGRVVGLYICMIFSPFAFLSRDMPMMGGITKLRWSDWQKELVSYAMLAPIFVFFLYIIYVFLSSNFVQQIGVAALTTGDFFEITLSIVIPMLIIFFLLQAAQKAAESFAGDIGKSIQGFGQQATGLAAGTAFGLATGGAGFLGRNVIGRGLRSYGNGTTGRKIMVDGKEVDETRAMRLASSAATSWTARQQSNFLRWGQTSSWNAANAGAKIGGKEYTVNDGVNKGLGLFGVKANNIAAGLSYVGKDAGKGGVIAVDKQRAEDRQKTLENRIKFDHLSDDQAKGVWENYKKEHINNATSKAAEKKWQEDKYIDQDAAVKPVAENLSRLQKENQELKTERLSLESEEADLKQKIQNGRSPSEIQRYEASLNENQAKQSSTKANLAANENSLSTAGQQLVTVRTATIENLKKDAKYKQSDAFLEAQKAADTDEEKRLNKYGKIKNAKMLTAAMRSEYAEDLRESSFWLEDGKPRWLPGLVGSAAAAGLAAALPGFGALIGMAILNEVGGGLVNNAFGNINSKATKSMVDSFKKTQGKGNKESRLSSELDDINEQIKNAVKAHFGDKAPTGDLDSWASDIVEKGIAGQSYIIEEKIRNLSDEITAARAARDQILEREKAVEKKVLEKQRERLNKIMEEKRRVQNDLDKTKADSQKAEDSKK